jgi:hypothetical protein
MEKSWRETEVKLERILDILHKSDSSNRKWGILAALCCNVP